MTEHFGPYELIELLGRGGMGEVWRAVDTRKGRTVALKRLPEVGSSIGKGIREFKRSLSDTQDAIMGSDEPRNLSSRPPEPPAQNQSSSGEPKRLSQ